MVDKRAMMKHYNCIINYKPEITYLKVWILVIV